MTIESEKRQVNNKAPNVETPVPEGRGQCIRKETEYVKQLKGGVGEYFTLPHVFRLDPGGI